MLHCVCVSVCVCLCLSECACVCLYKNVCVRECVEVQPMSVLAVRGGVEDEGQDGEEDGERD